MLLSSKGSFDIVRIKFDCMISSKFDVIGRIKFEFSPNIYHPLRYMYVKRRKASVVATPVAVCEQ